MKARSIAILTIIFAFAALSVNAQSKNVKTNIKVYGNCAMCKKRIETALDTKGVKQAIWDTKTKELQVVYASSKITEQEIHQLVAAVGHDTDKVKANDEVYAELPFCCLYRDHDHSGIKEEPHNH
jgi:mercuric ion binding protein